MDLENVPELSILTTFCMWEKIIVLYIFDAEKEIKTSLVFLATFCLELSRELLVSVL